MMSLNAVQRIFDNDLAAMEADLGGAFEGEFFFPAESQTGLPCQVTQIDASALGDEFGYLLQLDFLLMVRVSVFGGNALPEPDDPIDVIHPVTGQRVHCTVKRKPVSQDGVSVNYGLKAQS